MRSRRLRAVTAVAVLVVAVLASGCDPAESGDPLPTEVLRWEPSGVHYVALAVRIHNDRGVPVTPDCRVSTFGADGRIGAGESFEIREPIPSGEDNTYRILTRLDAAGVSEVEVECRDRPE